MASDSPARLVPHRTFAIWSIPELRPERKRDALNRDYRRMKR
jgi:hypothetical protein